MGEVRASEVQMASQLTQQAQAAVALVQKAWPLGPCSLLLHGPAVLVSNKPTVRVYLLASPALEKSTAFSHKHWQSDAKHFMRILGQLPRTLLEGKSAAEDPALPKLLLG